MALAGMDDGQTRQSRRIEQAPGRRDGPAQQRDVVAQYGAKAAGLEKIALHVDDHEAGVRRVEIKWIRLCFDDRHGTPDEPQKRPADGRSKVQSQAGCEDEDVAVPRRAGADHADDFLSIAQLVIDQIVVLHSSIERPLAVLGRNLL